MKADDAKRLKDLEKENQRLKRLVADKELEIDALREISRGNRLFAFSRGWRLTGDPPIGIHQ